jgi:hypothetical protein
MTAPEVIEIFRQSGATLERWLNLTSGPRSPVFIQKAFMYPQIPPEMATISAVWPGSRGLA